MKYEIVTPTRADIPALAAMHTKCWQQAYRGIFPDAVLDGLSVLRRIEGWTERLANAQVFARAAHVEGTWLGFVHAGPVELPGHNNEGEIYGLYVDEGKYRQGVGRRLFDLAKSDLADRGFTRVVLGVLTENIRAKRFYDAMGGKALDQTLSFTLEGVEYPEVVYEFEI